MAQGFNPRGVWQTRQRGFNIGVVQHEGRVVHFTDRAQLPAIQKVRSEFFECKSAPVSTSVTGAGLGHEDFLVELTPIAVIPFERFVQPISRNSS